MIGLLLLVLQGGWAGDQAIDREFRTPTDVSAAGLTYSVSRLRDPAPAANPVIPKWENAYAELVGTLYEQYIRPGSAGRPGAPYEMWAKQAYVDHLIRLHGKGGLPFNPRGKFYFTPGTTWGVGSQGWNDHYDMIYQIHRVYHYQGALFGQPWGNIAWWLPEFRPGNAFGTPRPTGTATKFQYWDYALDWKIQFLWWKWFQTTGYWHPWCTGQWAGRCGPPPPVFKTRLPAWLTGGMR